MQNSNVEETLGIITPQSLSLSPTEAAPVGLENAESGTEIIADGENIISEVVIVDTCSIAVEEQVIQLSDSGNSASRVAGIIPGCRDDDGESVCASEESDEGFGAEVTEATPNELFKEPLHEVTQKPPSEVTENIKEGQSFAAKHVSAMQSPSTKASSNEHELRRFGLSSQDKVLESFSCALYPKKGLPTHGRMFITQHFVAFSGWKDMRVLLPMRKVSRIEKTNTLLYIPNALLIVMDDKSEYFFASFIDRDACVKMLNNLIEIERRILEIHGDDNALLSRELEFGYQTKQPRSSSSSLSFQSFLMGSEKQPVASASAPAVRTNAVVSPPVEVVRDEVADGEVDADATIEVKDLAASGPKESPPSKAKDIPAPVDVCESSAGTSSNIVDSKTTSEPDIIDTCEPNSVASPSRTGKAKSKPQLALSPVRSNLSTFMTNSNVQWLWKEDVQCPCQHLWKPCWMYSCGYGDFLRDEGALDLQYTEWTPFDGSVDEDIHFKNKFNFQREFTYSFPRTTMLMFGPKFAPIKQIQYLYIPDGNVKSFEDLEGHLPQQAVVLFITKFEGIPMADVFKVLQYWIIDQNPHHEASPSPVAELGRSAVYLQVGVAIHYVKSSLFKSQILSGTRDEVTPQIKKYVLYAQLRAAEYKRALDQDGFQALETDIAIVDAARRRYSGTISHAVVESAAAAAAATAATTPVASIPSVASMEPHPNLELVTYVAWVIGVVIALFCGWYLLSTHRQVSLLIKQVDQLQQALLENTKLLQTVLEKQNNLCS